MIDLLSVGPCAESQSLKKEERSLEAIGVQGPGGLEAAFRNFGFCPKAKGNCPAVVHQRLSSDQVSGFPDSPLLLCQRRGFQII